MLTIASDNIYMWIFLWRGTTHMIILFGNTSTIGVLVIFGELINFLKCFNFASSRNRVSKMVAIMIKAWKYTDEKLAVY